MFDCSKDLIAYHNEEVTLPQIERSAMRDRRNANRDRLKKRLREAHKPEIDKFIKQGSYAMLTMVQDPENDYDIDDGVYFKEGSLRGEDGKTLSPLQVREMICEALQDDRFNKKPQVHDSCVRVYYNEGYHVDMPVYRTRDADEEYELASAEGWVVSRAADVESWFDEKNQNLSPDAENGRQFRRIVRILKKFARSRKNWKEEIATGFSITKLVSECYVKNADREDQALRGTMEKLYERLRNSLVVCHPVTTGAHLTKGLDDPRMRFFRERLKEALEHLAVLDAVDCTAARALSAWDRVFNASFFSGRLIIEEAAKNLAVSSMLKSASDAVALGFPDRAITPNKPAGFA